MTVGAAVPGRHQHEPDRADQRLRGRLRRPHHQEQGLVLGRLRRPGPVQLHHLRPAGPDRSSTTSPSSSTPSPSPGTGSRSCPRPARTRTLRRQRQLRQAGGRPPPGPLRPGQPDLQVPGRAGLRQHPLPLGQDDFDEHGAVTSSP
ncbi:MAG: hypothetical protein MZU84_01835 [Sphingobacterium sp.]|nr:hypothetical protein [Sphingobacterium sp.]